MNADTRKVIEILDYKEFDELDIMEKLSIELSISSLFFDQKGNTSITLYKNKKETIKTEDGRTIEIDQPQKIDFNTEDEKNKLFDEFEVLFNEKINTYGSKDGFLKTELTELELYNKRAITSTHKELVLWTEFLKKKQKNSIKTESTFISLFKDYEPKANKSNNAQKVKEIFKTHYYIDENDQWIGLTKNKTELLTAYHVLEPILKSGEVTTQATIFYNEFGLLVGKGTIKNGEYITDRSIRTIPFNDSRTEFERIFASLLPKK